MPDGRFANPQSDCSWPLLRHVRRVAAPISHLRVKRSFRARAQTPWLTPWPRSSFRGAQRPAAITGAAPRKPWRIAEASASATQA